MSEDHIRTEALLRIIAFKQAGIFSYEENPHFTGKRTVSHIIRFSEEKSGGLNLPILVASDILAAPDRVLPALTDRLNAAPAMAAELMRLRRDRNYWNSLATGTHHEIERLEQSVTDLRKDRDFWLARAASLVVADSTRRNCDGPENA